MKIIIVRHGETIDNVAKRMQGNLPGKLTDNGIDQAKLLGNRLKNEKIDYIYSSDLTRASDTTKEIITHHPEVKVVYTEELRELNMGEHQGKTKEEVGQNPNLSMIDLPTPKGGETKEEIYRRAENFIHKVFHEHKNDTILFSTHGAFIKTVRCVLEKKPKEEIVNMAKTSNTSVTIYEIDEDKNHNLILFNCTEHLE